MRLAGLEVDVDVLAGAGGHDLREVEALARCRLPGERRGVAELQSGDKDVAGLIVGDGQGRDTRIVGVDAAEGDARRTGRDRSTATGAATFIAATFSTAGAAAFATRALEGDDDRLRFSLHGE